MGKKEGSRSRVRRVIKHMRYKSGRWLLGEDGHKGAGEKRSGRGWTISQSELYKHAIRNHITLHANLKQINSEN